MAEAILHNLPTPSILKPPDGRRRLAVVAPFAGGLAAAAGTSRRLWKWSRRLRWAPHLSWRGFPLVGVVGGWGLFPPIPPAPPTDTKGPHHCPRRGCCLTDGGAATPLDLRASATRQYRPASTAVAVTAACGGDNGGPVAAWTARAAVTAANRPRGCESMRGGRRGRWRWTAGSVICASPLSHYDGGRVSALPLWRPRLHRPHRGVHNHRGGGARVGPPVRGTREITIDTHRVCRPHAGSLHPIDDRPVYGVHAAAESPPSSAATAATAAIGHSGAEACLDVHVRKVAIEHHRHAQRPK